MALSLLGAYDLRHTFIQITQWTNSEYTFDIYKMINSVLKAVNVKPLWNIWVYLYPIVNIRGNVDCSSCSQYHLHSIGTSTTPMYCVDLTTRGYPSPNSIWWRRGRQKLLAKAEAQEKAWFVSMELEVLTIKNDIWHRKPGIGKNTSTQHLIHHYKKE